jgi:hypothetical protein
VISTASACSFPAAVGNMTSFPRMTSSPLIIADGFAGFDASTRQMPARDVGMPDQKDPPLAIDRHAAHAEREPA